jgi:hypothetical protein
VETIRWKRPDIRALHDQLDDAERYAERAGESLRHEHLCEADDRTLFEAGSRNEGCRIQLLAGTEVS